MNNPDLSVIIPAYNESTNFKNGKIAAMYNYLKKLPLNFEVLFINDGSSDNTGDLLTAFAQTRPEIRVVNAPHKGKGPTLAAGLIMAKGESRLFTDFDQATPIEEIEKLLPFRQQHFDIIIGSREIEGAKREREPLYRHIMGKGFNLIVKLFIIRGITDTQCGFKLLSAEAVGKIIPKLSVTNSNKTRVDAFTGAFDVEVLYLAKKYGFRIAEVPVHWRHFKTTRVSPIKDSLRMFVEVLKIRFNALMGKYK